MGRIIGVAANRGGGPVVLTIPPPSGDTTGATDAAAIQAVINASNVGDTVYFGAGTWYVNATISLKPKRYYVGATRDNSIIKQANSTNLSAVLASEAWLATTGAAVADSPTYIKDLGIDGNKANQASGSGIGLVTMTFWNDISRLLVQNTFGDGIRLTDTRKDSTVLSTTTAVENHIFKCDIRHAGAHGIHIADSGASQVTDGWVMDCIIHDVVGDGIRIESSEGWLVQGNHLYSIPKNGIFCGRGYYTRVIGNYIETFGNSTTPGNYSGIAFGDGTLGWISSQGPISIVGNVVKYSTAADAASFIRGIRVGAGTNHTGEIVITGNGLHGTTHPGTSVGILVTNQDSTATVNCLIGPNFKVGWDTPVSLSANSGTLTAPGLRSKTLTVAVPTNAENISIMHCDDAITITKVHAVVRGSSSPSVTFNLPHGLDRSAAGTNLFSSDQAITSTTTGTELVTFNDATLAADEMLWFTTSAASGTLLEMVVTVYYMVDAA